MAQLFCLKPGVEPQVLLTRLVSYIVFEGGKPLYGRGFEDLEPPEPSSFAGEREVRKPFPGRAQIARRLCLT
eukprot:160868-Amphidinium_carterae.1